MTRYHHCLAGLAAALLIVAAAQAQTPKPPSSGADNTVPQNVVPQESTPGKDSGSNPLSEQLSRSGGVIKPPTNVDRQIQAPTPDPGPKSMPVVPPPGSPGGNPDVKPK